MYHQRNGLGLLFVSSTIYPFDGVIELICLVFISIVLDFSGPASPPIVLDLSESTLSYGATFLPFFKNTAEVGWARWAWNVTFSHSKRGRISSANSLNLSGFFLLEKPKTFLEDDWRH